MSRSYVMSYGFLIFCFYFAHRDDLTCLPRLAKRLQQLTLFLNAEIPPVSVIMITCYALYPVCLIPRHKHRYILRVKPSFLADLAIPFPFRLLALTSPIGASGIPAPWGVQRGTAFHSAGVPKGQSALWHTIFRQESLVCYTFCSRWRWKGDVSVAAQALFSDSRTGGFYGD